MACVLIQIPAQVVLELQFTWWSRSLYMQHLAHKRRSFVSLVFTTDLHSLTATETQHVCWSIKSCTYFAGAIASFKNPHLLSYQVLFASVKNAIHKKFE